MKFDVKTVNEILDIDDAFKAPTKLMELMMDNGKRPSWMPVFTYDPRNYWYQVEEMSDRALPFLLFNMAIRGMNGVAVQCDSLTRMAHAAYFIRNDSDDYLAFSKIVKLPKNDEVLRACNLKGWE